MKNGILNIDSPYFRVSNFNYNKTSKKIYVLSDAVIYSFNFDLNTGNYSLINSDIMHKRTSD
ncbi:MAG TPA: hypothetical protein VHO28_13640, partial [Ignavibacteriales bacterium]|nr:hypothetical protein [Ignavibacteriales bacterium]